MFNYSPVEWIQNSTSTSSSIELNYYPSSATKIEVDAAFLTTRSSGYVFGIFTNNTTRAFWTSVDTSQLYFGSGNTSSGYNKVYSYKNYLDNVKRTYRFELGKVLVDGTEVATATKTQTFSSYGYKLNWFAGSISGTTQIIQQVSEIRIYEAVDGVDTLIQRYVPVIRWSDRVVGFLEENSNYFYQAPAYYTHGAILSEYTPNLNLRVGFKPEETVHYYISEDSKNFKLVDDAYPTIKNKDITLTALFANIDQKLLIDKNEKDAIWRLINNKLDLVDDKDVVLNTLITKLNTDYSKEQLDGLIANNDDLKAVISKLCDEIMLDYYTKAEVDELVSKGGGGKMDNYYTKKEIDEKIPEAEDLSKIQQFLDNMTDYYNNLKLFTALNGKGE